MMGEQTRDVVMCMVSDTYTDSVRRGFYSTADQTLLSLLSAPQIRRVLLVDHPRGVASQLKRRLRGDAPAPRSGKLRGTRPWTMRVGPQLNPPAMRRRYGAVDAQIAVAARRYGLVAPALITFDLFHAAFGDPRWANQTIFYAQDDEREIPRLASRRAMTELAYERVSAGPLSVVTVTRELLNRIRPEGPGLVVPNGIDPDLWAHLRAIRPPELAQADGRPLAAYAGTIDTRLDVSAFVQVASAGWQVALAGPVADQAVGQALSHVPGVNLLGSLPREQVTGLLRAADVCVLAHVDSPLTRAMSPLKLFEYLASGTPVVATDLPGVREGWPEGKLVSPGGDYVAACRAVTAAGRVNEATRRTAVAGMSWRARHGPLVELVVGML